MRTETFGNLLLITIPEIFVQSKPWYSSNNLSIHTKTVLLLHFRTFLNQWDTVSSKFGKNWPTSWSFRTEGINLYLKQYWKQTAVTYMSILLFATYDPLLLTTVFHVWRWFKALMCIGIPDSINNKKDRYKASKTEPLICVRKGYAKPYGRRALYFTFFNKIG